MNHSTTIKPDWATNAASELDLSDNLHDARGSEDACTGFFAHTYGYDAPFNPDEAAQVYVTARLLGISIERAPGQFTYANGHEAITILGPEAINRVEQWHSETLTEEYEA